MKNDLIFKTGDFVFSYRVAGILIINNKILLQKPLNDRGYSFVGGHVALQETTAETLAREYMEEINAKIKVDKLFAVGEIFFPWGKKPCHQISLYYNVSLPDQTSIPLDGIFKGYDEIGTEKIDIDFTWIALDRLESIEIYPKELVPYILDNKNGIHHFISKQI